MSDGELTCARDGLPTRLHCASCNVPICPACFVRTEVGLRCPDCGRARPGWQPQPQPRSRQVTVGAVALAGALVLAVGVLAAVAKQGPSSSPAGGPIPTQVLEFEDAPAGPTLPTPPPPTPQTFPGGQRPVERPDLGISFTIPETWAIAPSDPGGGAFLAASPLAGGGPLGWLRISPHPSTGGVARTAERVMGDILGGRQGVRDLGSGPTFVATRPAWSVRFTVPLAADGSGPLTEQTYYFVDAGERILAFAFGSLGTGGTGHGPAAQATMASLRLA